MFPLPIHLVYGQEQGAKWKLMMCTIASVMTSFSATINMKLIIEY